MRFCKLCPVSILLLLVGLTLCAGNLWYTATRSTIPLSLAGTVQSKQVRTEHAPGVDDVHFLILSGGRTLHVDRPVYEAVRTGDRIQKHAWERELRHGDQTITLGWSVDTARMLVVMPLTFATLAALALFA